MKKENTAVVIHACGFASRESLCPVFMSRIGKAIELILSDRGYWNKQKDSNIKTTLITGGVSYESSSPTLAKCAGKEFRFVLAGDFLVDGHREELSIFYAENCFNSSTDTKDALLICLGQKVDSIMVVSSYWHNWVLKQTYKRWMEKLN